MTAYEITDIPTMDEVCYGKHHCEECMEYNYPEECPCGEPSDA